MKVADRLRVRADFVRWFAGSRVINAEGEPLVVFHATDAAEDFDRFDRTEDIGYHYGSAECANERLRQMADVAGDCAPGMRIIPVALAMRNPLRLPDLATWGPRDVASALVDAGVVTQAAADSVDIVDVSQVRAWLRAAGYDGIVYRNETEGGGDSYIAVDPRVIKSALTNSGRFRGPCFCR